MQASQTLIDLQQPTSWLLLASAGWSTAWQSKCSIVWNKGIVVFLIRKHSTTNKRRHSGSNPYEVVVVNVRSNFKF
jgi:hypothetical protein